MNSLDSSQKDIFERFQEKIEELKNTLPPLGRTPGNSCAANTLDNILDVLNIKDSEKSYFHNLAIPFSGFGSYETRKGWKGPCGIVSGAIAAIGIIMGGQETTKKQDVPLVFTKALRFSDKFESKYGSLSCWDLCGHDLSKDYQTYVKDKVWENICHKMVLFAIEQVMKLTRKDLKTKWK
ncbi:MAG: C_GCAxxG_C_C family protein [Promethearchaeota archaeon]|nr:MAG: C_GCAxxG_C_C family protein [Candidatus Lokiarchaeota archaeon]